MLITQSALSQQIAKLEYELDVQLFDCSRRRVALTDADLSLFEEGGIALKQRTATTTRFMDLAKKIFCFAR